MSLVALSALTAATLSLVAWRRRRSPLGFHFLFFWLVGFFYSFGYMCELASDSLAAIRFWLRVESLGIAFLPTVWILLAIRLTGGQKDRWPRLSAFLLMLSTMTFIISNTSEFHHLHYGPLALNPEAPFPVVNFEPGPWYWVHIAFINLAVLFGNVLYARSWKRAPARKSRQAFALFLGSLFPWVLFIAYLFKVIPWGIDPTPIAFLVPGLVYAWAIFALDMLEIAPIARQAVFQRLSDGVLVFDKTGRLADFNAAAGRVFMGLTADARGRAGREVFRDYPAMESILDGSADEERIMWLEAGGKKATYELQRIELNDEDGEAAGFMIILRDISGFSTIVEGLKLQAAIDPLTRVWNRGRWEEDGKALLELVRQNQSSIALILADLDDFKQVNDSYGHLLGDAALQKFVLTCRKNLRVNDIFGRFGGDEFVIILAGVDTARAMELAERLRRAVEVMRVRAGEEDVAFTASFGVVTEAAGGLLSLEELIAKADKALYEAKAGGGNRVCLS